MEIILQTGISKEIEKLVKPEDTAKQYGSGLVEVLATPSMIALMENASYLCVQDKLPDGYGTVGFEVHIQHLKPTFVGQKVAAKSQLIKVEGKKLTFELMAHDEKGLIGKGTHIRYIINQKEFMLRNS